MSTSQVPEFLLPPSPVYPIVGAALGYILTEGEKKPFVMIAGALAGILVNVATRSIQLQAERAQASGENQFSSSLGTELLAATIGKKTADDAHAAEVASGPRLFRAHG